MQRELELYRETPLLPVSADGRINPPLAAPRTIWTLWWQGDEALSNLPQGARLCLKTLFLLPRPEFSLFRSTFPETNKSMLSYFLKEKTVKSLIMLLAVLRLDAPARAVLYLGRKLLKRG